MSEGKLLLSNPLVVTGSGAYTAVGRNAAMTFASLRAGISRIQETVYRTVHGEPVMGAPVSGIVADSIGVSYLTSLAYRPLAECIKSAQDIPSQRIALFLGVEESDPTGIAPQLNNQLLHALESVLQLSFSKHSQVFPYGDVSVAFGLSYAADLLSHQEVDYCIIGGVQTYLVQAKLRELEESGRLKTGRNSDGVIPGEAACFVGVTLAEKLTNHISKPCIIISGVGFAQETTLAGDEPNRGSAWTRAVRDALSQANIESKNVSFRPTNVTGERALFLECGLAAVRIYLEEMPLPPSWYPAGSVGTIGAGVGALLIGWASEAFHRGYALGPVALCELASDSGRRAAIVVRAE